MRALRRIFAACILFASVEVVQCQPAPTITEQPTNTVAIAGQPATLSVTATGTGTLTYQWRHFGIAIAGATNATFTLGGTEMADAGSYDVVIADGLTSTVSLPVNVSVGPPSYPNIVQPKASFNPRFEINGVASTVTVAPDGKFYVAGTFSSVDGVTRINLARFNADGSLDTAFDHRSFLGGVPTVLTWQNDGMLLVGGTFGAIVASDGTTTNVHGLVRLNTDGTRDTTFSPPLIGGGTIVAISAQTDGKILVSGAITPAILTGGVPNPLFSPPMIRLNSDGSTDATFAPIAINVDGSVALNGQIQAIALQTDGKVLVGGLFTSYNSFTVNRIARLNSDGTVDATFVTGTGFNSTVRTLGVQADGKIVVGGAFSTFNGTTANRVARLLANGALDATLVTGTGLNGSVNRIAIQADGKIVLGGLFTAYNGVALNRLARIDAAGVLDATFNIGTGFDNAVAAVDLQPDGMVLVGGSFTTANDAPHTAVARLSSTGALDSSVAPVLGQPGRVSTIVPAPGGKWLVGGLFNQVNGVNRNGIVRLNTDGSVDLSLNPGAGFTYRPDATATISTMAIQADGKIVAGGLFTAYNGTGRGYIARFLADGTIDATFNPDSGFSSLGVTSIMKLVLQADGKIVVGGFFSTYNDTSRNNIARLASDGSLDSTFNPGTGFNSGVRSLAIQPDGKIVAGGDFTTFNGASRNCIVRLAPEGTVDATFDPGTGFNDRVIALALQADGTIVAGGAFSTYNGTSRSRIARLTASGALDPIFNSGIGPNDNINTLGLQTDGKIVAGGAFTTYDGASMGRLARVDSSGTLDSTFRVATTSTLSAASSISTQSFSADGNLLVGGGWWAFNGFSGGGLVLLEPEPATAPVITAQSGNTVAPAGGGAAFTVSTTSNSPVTLRWQRSTDGGTNWNDLVNDSTFGGVTTDRLEVTNVTGAMHGHRFRVVVTNGNASMNSAAATLSVEAGYTFTTLAGDASAGSVDGSGAAARFDYPYGLALDAAGNVYAGDYFNHTVRRITPAGVVTTIAGNPDEAGSTDGNNSAARFNSPAGMAVGIDGSIYVSDNRNHTIRKVSPTGDVTTLAGSPGLSGSANGVGSAARFFSPIGIAVAASGNVYVADADNHTIRKITPAGEVSTLAGSPGQYGNVNATGSAARFWTPFQIALDSSENLYVADYANIAIRKVTPAGVVTTFATSTIFFPLGVAVDASNNVFVANSDSSISKVTSGGLASAFAGAAFQQGSADGTGAAARFAMPNGLVVDPSGNLFVADSYNNTVRKISTGGVVTTLAGLPPGADDGTGSAARFRYPRSLAIDGAGNAFVADGGNQLIRKITPDGTVLTFAGGVGQSGTADGTGTTARFNGLTGLALSTNGNFYVADTANFTIRQVTPAGVVTTFAGSAGQSGITDGTGGVARFGSPNGIAADSAGNLYVTDLGSSTIRKITPAGVVSTFAGLAGQSGSTDGAGSAARFGSPTGVVVASDDTIYIADTFYHTIRKITPQGTVTTLAGSPGLSGGLDGAGSAARFNMPDALALDEAGNVIVVDSNNQTIRRITPAGVVTTIAGSVGIRGNTDGSGSAARFLLGQAYINNGGGVAIDGSGQLYVSDVSNHTIRKGVPSLYVTVAPRSLTSNIGANANFTATTIGAGSISHQWQRSINSGVTWADLANDDVYGGVTTVSLAITSTTTAMTGHRFRCIATSSEGFAASNAVSLAVLSVDLPRPTITTQPGTVHTVAGGDAALSVAATGTGIVTYQWRRGGLPIADATGPQLALANVNLTDAGFYDVVVTDSLASTISDGGRLIVGPASYPNVLRLDRTFNPTFETSSSPYGVSALAVAPEGSFYVGGAFSSVDGLARAKLVRFRSDGTVDAVYVPALIQGRSVDRLALAPDGKLILSGRFNHVGGAARMDWARLNADGTVDLTFDAPELSVEYNRVRELLVQADGRILAALDLASPSASDDSIVRLNADGSLDPVFNVALTHTAGPANIFAMVLQPDGKVLLGGYFDGVNGEVAHHVVRLNTDGSRDETFDPGTGFDSSVQLLALQPDGRILAGGNFLKFDGAPADGMVRLNADGSRDATFAASAEFPGFPSEIGLQSDGGIIVLQLGFDASGLVRFNSNGTLDAGYDAAAVLPGLAGEAVALGLLPDGSALVAGGFAEAAGVPRPGVVKFGSNGDIDPTFAPAIRTAGDVHALVPLWGGDWLVGGEFEYVNGSPRHGIARLHADGSLDDSFIVEDDRIQRVTTIVVQPDGRIVLGAILDSFEGLLARYEATGLADLTFAGGNTGTLDGPVDAVAAMPDGSLVVSGGFSRFADETRLGLVRLDRDGNLDEAFASDIPFDQALDPIRLWPLGDGTILVGGFYQLWNDPTPDDLLRLAADGFLQTAFHAGRSLNGSPEAVVIAPGGAITLGGWFTTVGESARSHLARLAPEGQLDTTLDPGTGFSDRVQALLLQADEKIVAAGLFDTYRGAARPVLARLNADGSRDESFSLRDDLHIDPVYGYVRQIAYTPEGGLLVAATSLEIPGFAAGGLIRLERELEALVTLGNLEQTYTGAPHAVTVTTSPASLAYNVTYDGSATPPTDAGTYTVSVTITEPGYAGSATAELLINRATADVQITETARAYDGTPKPVTVVTIPGGLATLVTYDGDPTPPTEFGTYAVVVTVVDANHQGSATATLQIAPGINPNQPGSVTVSNGGPTMMTVSSAGGGPDTTYQWQVELLTNGSTAIGAQALQWVDIPGATGASYSIASTQRFNAARYRVIVTTLGVARPSLPFTVAVSAPPPNSARLLNLSTRGLAGAGANQLFPGFVVQGTGTKRLLIRAVGPTLAAAPINFPFPVAPDPRMELKRYNFTTQAYEDVVANDDWQTNPNAADIITASAALGAFALTDPKDATLLVDLSAGQYAVVAGDKNGTAGIAIVELYDADSGNPSTRLINISNRGFAGVGAEVMIPGFVVSDEGPKTLLVRVVGPTLGSFNVPGTMADPKLTIYRHNFTTNADDLLLTNDNWSDNPDATYTAQIAAQVLAFPLNQGSADAAFVVTLTPGVYTVIGSSANGTGTGVVLVEVYVVP